MMTIWNNWILYSSQWNIRSGWLRSDSPLRHSIGTWPPPRHPKNDWKIWNGFQHSHEAHLLIHFESTGVLFEIAQAKWDWVNKGINAMSMMRSTKRSSEPCCELNQRCWNLEHRCGDDQIAFSMKIASGPVGLRKTLRIFASSKCCGRLG